MTIYYRGCHSIYMVYGLLGSLQGDLQALDIILILLHGASKDTILDGVLLNNATDRAKEWG